MKDFEFVLLELAKLLTILFFLREVEMVENT